MRSRLSASIRKSSSERSDEPSWSTTDGRSMTRRTRSARASGAVTRPSSTRSWSIVAAAPGRCTFTTTRRPSASVARCTWPMVPAASGCGSIEPNASSHGTPSSCSITATTSPSVIGGTDDCSERSSSTYSGATRSGRVDSICPSFPNVGPSTSNASRSWRGACTSRGRRSARPASPRTTAGPSTRAISRARPSSRRSSSSVSGSASGAPVFTTVTVHWARCVTRLATLPSRNSLRPRMPLLPTTRTSAPAASAASTISSAIASPATTLAVAAGRSACALSASSDAERSHSVLDDPAGSTCITCNRASWAVASVAAQFTARAAVPEPSVATATTRTASSSAETSVVMGRWCVAWARREVSPLPGPSRHRGAGSEGADEGGVALASTPRQGVARSEGADEGGVALASTTAEGGGTEATTAAAQLVDDRADDPRARHADRVAERDRAAVHVDDVVVDAEVAHRRDADGGERLVQLEQVHVGERQVRLVQRPLDGTRRLGEQRRVGTGHHAEAHELGDRGAAELLGLVAAHHDQRSRAVGDLRGVAGGDGAVLGERRPQAGEGLGGGLGTHALVLEDHHRVALALGHRHRDDLVGETTLLHRRG